MHIRPLKSKKAGETQHVATRGRGSLDAAGRRPAARKRKRSKGIRWGGKYHRYALCEKNKTKKES
jgi:hypothetical protein